jgi:hypothetical protein
MGESDIGYLMIQELLMSSAVSDSTRFLAYLPLYIGMGVATSRITTEFPRGDITPVLKHNAGSTISGAIHCQFDEILRHLEKLTNNFSELHPHIIGLAPCNILQSPVKIV